MKIFKFNIGTGIALFYILIVVVELWGLDREPDPLGALAMVFLTLPSRAFMKTELDFREYLRTPSNFDQVIYSEWLNELREKDHSHKIKPDHKHYIIFTYDDVFDVICQSFELTLLESSSQ